MFVPFCDNVYMTLSFFRLLVSRFPLVSKLILPISFPHCCTMKYTLIVDAALSRYSACNVHCIFAILKVLGSDVYFDTMFSVFSTN